jgi:hypothetical protein
MTSSLEDDVERGALEFQLKALKKHSMALTEYLRALEERMPAFAPRLNRVGQSNRGDATYDAIYDAVYDMTYKRMTHNANANNLTSLSADVANGAYSKMLHVDKGTVMTSRMAPPGSSQTYLSPRRRDNFK